MDIFRQPLRNRFFETLVIGFSFAEIACLDHLGCKGKGNGGKEGKMGMKEHDKRFGVTAVEKGFITLEQLFDAMKIQLTEDIEKREHRLLGTILFDMGVLSPPQIDEVLHSMGKKRTSYQHNCSDSKRNIKRNAEIGPDLGFHRSIIHPHNK